MIRCLKRVNFLLFLQQGRLLEGKEQTVSTKQVHQMFFRRQKGDGETREGSFGWSGVLVEVEEARVVF